MRAKILTRKTLAALLAAVLVIGGIAALNLTGAQSALAAETATTVTINRVDQFDYLIVTSGKEYKKYGKHVRVRGLADGLYPWGTNNIYNITVPSKIEGVSVKDVSFGSGDTTDINIKSLNVNACKELRDLSITSDVLTKLNVSKNKKLIYLHAGYKLKKLNLSKNTKLEELYVSGNKLKKLDLSKNKKLKILYANHNKLKKLDLSKNKKLIGFDLNSNKLSKLDLSKNKRLTGIYLYNNRLTKLDLSKNKKLTWLTVNDNKLKKLDLSKNKKLGVLLCYGNKIKGLDISKNPKMYTIWVDKKLKKSKLNKLLRKETPVYVKSSGGKYKGFWRYGTGAEM